MFHLIIYNYLLAASIQAAKLSCIYEYPVENSTLDRIVLADAFTVRSLMDMSESVADTSFIGEEKTDLLESDLDIESLFGCENRGFGYWI